MDIAELRQKILLVLEKEPDLFYSMDELSEQFGLERWLVQKAVSQLHDARRVHLRVKDGHVYARWR